MSTILLSDELTWDFRGGLHGWQCNGFLEASISEEGGLTGRTNAASTLDSPPPDLEASAYDTLELRFASSRNDVFGICVGSNVDPLDDNYKMLKCLPEAGRLCLFRLRLTPAMNWQGKVNAIRITPSRDESSIRIASIRLFKSDENELVNGDLRIMLDDRPALWSFGGNARFVQGAPSHVELDGADAKAQVPFAPVDIIGTFRFSFESRGSSTRAAIIFFDAEDQPFARQEVHSEASDDWRSCETEVAVPEYAYRAVVEFASQGSASLRNVRAVRLSTAPLKGAMKEWTPSPEVAALAEATPRGLPECRVAMENGVATLFINGRRHSAIHSWFSRFDAGHSKNADRICGIELEAVSIGDAGFTEHGYDYSELDRLMAQHCLANPSAYFILYMDFDGDDHPWWCRQHPEELCRPEDGGDTVGAYGGGLTLRPSISSQVWQETFEEVLRRLIRHVKDSPYASRIAGFQTAAGISFEWMHYGSQNRQFVDYAPCAQEDFRNFLRERYQTDEALQNTWHDGQVTLETAAVPSTARRSTPANGLYFDVNTERDVIDYNDYQHYVMSHCITRFGKAIKEETDGRSLNGAFFGYTVVSSDMIFMGQAMGHNDSRHVLDSPYVDYLIAPVAYNQRRPGAFTESMLCPWSCNANGKIFFNHIDFRHHHAPESDFYRTDGIDETRSVLLRELARNLAQGNPFQFYDFSHGWTFGDKRICQIVKEMQDLYRQYRWTVKDFDKKNYLLVVIDEKLMGRFDPFNPPFGRELVYNQMTYLDAAGIPYRCVLFSDLMKYPELQEYSAFLFLNQFRLDDETTAFLQEKILTGDRFAAFVGPVGILTPDGISTQNAERLFGRAFAVSPEERDAHCTATALWPELDGQTWGAKARDKYPFIMLPEAAAPEETVGTMAGDQAPGALYLERPGCRIYWSAVASTTPEMLRALACRAGVPVVADTNDALYIGCGFIGVHAHTNGPRTIRLIGEGTPKDILTGQTWPRGTTEITFEMEFGENRIFILEDD
ncbi:MAG: beta-galactosidase [Victivallales bacterium]|nr:beta-galactosidase [Victivallales bacterium]